MNSLSKYIQKPTNLEKAWRRIKASSNTSSSPYIRDDTKKFADDAPKQIRSIAGKIQQQSYKFSPARGVILKKKGKPGSERPIVMPRVEDRVVQRCMLEAMTLDPIISAEAFQPNSFGGIPAKADDLGGVPAALKRLLEAIDAGGTHVMVADISKFFTKIRKADVLKKMSSLTDDQKFIDLFYQGICIDLENAEDLSRKKHLFPYGDVGVGQGVCLSPFVGNLILSDFDKEMNSGDCTCIRYIDDIIIIAPSGKAASSKMRLAKRLLNALGMEVSKEKSSPLPIPVNQKFEYLGIEFSADRMRPSKKSRASIQQRCKEVAAKSISEMQSCKKAEDFSKDYSIPKTLDKISGMVRGWSHHYKFCDYVETIRNVDREIAKSFLLYAGKAQTLSQAAIENGQLELATMFLGYAGSKDVKFSPLVPNSELWESP